MIYNENFKVGEKYKSLVNGITFSVVGRIPPWVVHNSERRTVQSIPALCGISV